MASSSVVAQVREITVAHSPDSDDAFMFYGLATNKVRVPGLKFSHTLTHIEPPNLKPLHGAYELSGLRKVRDLGKWSHEHTGRPLSLGGNAVRRKLGRELMATVSQALRQSIQYGLDHREEALAYAMQFARDLDTQKADRFVGMYVNERTLDYGADGKEAVARLLDMGYRAGIIPKPPDITLVSHWLLPFSVH